MAGGLSSIAGEFIEYILPDKTAKNSMQAVAAQFPLDKSVIAINLRHFLVLVIFVNDCKKNNSFGFEKHKKNSMKLSIYFLIFDASRPNAVARLEIHVFQELIRLSLWPEAFLASHSWCA